MKRGWKYFLFALLILPTVLLAGCQQSAGADDTFTIGYVPNNLNDTFQTYLLEDTKRLANKEGMKVEVGNPQDDLIQQQDIVNSFITNGVDALVVVPVDTSSVEPITKAAVKAGIPLIYVNRNPFSGVKESDIPDNVYYVGTDEKQAGIMQAEYAAKKTGGKGGIGVIAGILGQQSTRERTAGVKDTVRDKYPGMKVLAVESAQFQRDQAVTLVENWMQTYGDKMNIICANNDEMALGAVQATKYSGKDYIICGVDGTPEGLKAVKSGKLDCTAYQGTEDQAQGVINILTKLRSGQKPKEKIHLIDFKLVTKDNVDEYIKGDEK